MVGVPEQDSGTMAIGFCIIPQSMTMSHASEYVELMLIIR